MSTLSSASTTSNILICCSIFHTSASLSRAISGTSINGVRMRRKRLLTAALCIAMASTAFADDDINAPPPGIATTSATLAQVLRAHAASKPLLSDTGSEQWDVSFGALHGTRTERWNKQRYRADEQLGPFHTADGRDAQGDWHQNENAEVVRESGLHLRDAIDERALARAGTPGSGVTLLGLVSTPTNAYVVKVVPPGGRLEFLFYDRSTYRLVRREQIRDG